MTLQDSTKVMLGATGSNDKVVSCENADPASFPAGLAVRRNSTGGLLIADNAVAALIGISLGPDLSDAKRTAVARTGNLIPLRTRVAYGVGTVTITSVANLLTGTPDSVTVGATEFTAQSGAATPGTATFRSATSVGATAQSLADQINAHAVSGPLVTATVVGAVVTLTAKSPGSGGDIALAYTDKGSATIGATVSAANLAGGDASMDTITIGAAVYVDSTTGEACDSADALAVATSAVVASGVLTGVFPDGSTVPCILINMPGGL